MFLFKKYNQLSDKLCMIENKLDILLAKTNVDKCTLCELREREIYQNMDTFISQKLDQIESLIKIDNNNVSNVINEHKKDITNTFNTIINNLDSHDTHIYNKIANLLDHNTEIIQHNIDDLNKKLDNKFKTILIKLLEDKINELDKLIE